ncbi:MAG TPA: urate oxidase, partial [Ktedonobacterales bacterium]|nr:urate oxidase [Ktedonobacterales bacterium]
MGTPDRFTISYGKARVPVYRVNAQPLTGVAPIPESAFTDRQNTLLVLEVDVEVFGSNFLPAYTEGDNSSVVATDSMKNFVLRQALEYTGATIEGFLDMLGRRFLESYAQMERLRLTARELPFVPAVVPTGAPGAFAASSVLFSRSHDDYTVATLEFDRDSGDGSAACLIEHRCGRAGMQLLKVTGSSFTHFVRDDFTTLPERSDRPLYIFMDASWTYTDAADMLDLSRRRYVPAEQMRDLVAVVFNEFVSESIQHLVHEMGTRIFARFPQLAEVSFEAQNRTPDPAAVSQA